jgi:hypothetical protein
MILRVKSLTLSLNSLSSSVVGATNPFGCLVECNRTAVARKAWLTGAALDIWRADAQAARRRMWPDMIAIVTL